MSNLYNVPLQNNIQRTLANTLNAGETSTITFSTNVSAVLQASASIPGILVIDRVDVNGTATPSLTEYISFTGVSGSTVTGLVRGLAGTSDIAHSVGAIVEFVPDVTWADAINDTFTEQHNADGTHKTLSLLSLVSAMINTSVINNSMINFASLVSSSIITSSLDTSTFNTNSAVLASNVSGAVNQVTITNSLVSTGPRITATGTDTNISLGLYGKGTGNVYPQMKAEKIIATALSTATGTAVDATGATVTIIAPFNAMAIVNATFDFELGLANDTAGGFLNVNGTDLSQSALFKANSISARSTVAQNYAVSLASGVASTLKLRFNRATGSGVVTAYQTHTGFSYFLLAT